MGEYSRAEIARRAGLEPDDLDQLIELQLLVPDADGRLATSDIRKAGMLQALRGAGIPFEGIAAGARTGGLSLGFMESPLYERFAAVGDESFALAAERTGVPVELLMVVREAAGGAMPHPEDRLREDELAVVPLIEAQLALGYRPRVIERNLRSLGEGLRRAADTEADGWRTELMEPLFARGGTAEDVTDLSVSEGSLRMNATMDGALLALWHAQEARAWTTNIIGGFEATLAKAGLLTRVSHPPAICFLDIAGYTRLTLERGDEAAAELAEGLNRLVTRTAAERGGHPVKWLGDGVMVHFPDPGPGVVAALEMVDGVTAAGLPPAHVGLHCGPVLFQEGDYFGQTVNMASRIADYARPGEVLVTQEVVEASADTGTRFTEIGPVELKGIVGTVRLHAAHRSG